MLLNSDRLWKAFNPSKPLNVDHPEDLKYYIDFSELRGGDITRQLTRTIYSLPDDPTCQLFTGHIGCGKSTEMLCLKNGLTKAGFHVVYFESSNEMDLIDVDVTDILIAIARQVNASLEAIGIRLKPNYFTRLFQEVNEILKTPMEFSGVDFSVGIATFSASAKDSPELRQQMRQIMEPRTNNILEAINKELLEPARAALLKKGYKGLVVLIDNLDRLENTEKSGKPQYAYLFVDRGEQLRRLNCHVVYTIPIVMMFSNDLNPLANRFGVDPQVLPVVTVRYPNGETCEPGINLLRQLILARAFPDVHPPDRLALVNQVFENKATLDRICWASGGHARNLLKLVFSCLQREDPPFSQKNVERVIRQRRNELLQTITEDEMALLKRVKQAKKLAGETNYEVLLKSMFVFEYRSDDYGHWFDVNPILNDDL